MRATIQNPWSAVPASTAFILPQDAREIAAFNERAREAQRIALDVLPEPFFGRRDAPLVVLLLNPGLSDETPKLHAKPAFAHRLRADIASTQPLHHFHLLDQEQGPGCRWWRRKCKQLSIDLQDPDYKVIAEKTLSIQFLPYHSKSFGTHTIKLPSQQYALALVSESMRRGAVVVCLRGYKHWVREIDSLEEYPKLVRAAYPRAGTLSRVNLGDDGYNTVLTAFNDA